MNEFAICSLITDDPKKFEEKVNVMNSHGYEPEGPMSVIPMMVADQINLKSRSMLLFVLLMKRYKVHCPNS
jgi:hypothetical protein